MKYIKTKSDVLSEREARIVSRGENTGHCHVITGGVLNEDGTFLSTEDDPCIIRHVLEDNWIREGKIVWTKEHRDIKLKPGVFKVVQQMVFDPVREQTRKVID